MFISLEGIEGSGKTSQINRLAAYFNRRGMSTLVTREPGGTDIGQKIRTILLDPANKDLSCNAELLLYMADRAQHLDAVIKPALKQGKTVICDRYADATVVYQGYARGLTPELMHQLHRLLFEDLKPDLTLLLDLEPKIGLARAWRQLDSGARSRREGRFEEEKLAFHERVRAGYLDLARIESARFRIIDAAQDEGAVWNDIRQILDAKLVDT